MALTTAQLVAQYTNANLGKAPDQATQLLLDAYASQTQTGSLTDGQATSKVIDLVDKTTSVAVATYQFFTGKTPSAAGLTFLVNSDDATGNKTDLNDAYYTKFATENRYINFAVNLGADPASEANASFKASYGTLTFRQVVEVAYEKVIGTAAAQAQGIDVAAAINFLARADNEAYLKAFVKQYAPGVDQDLGVKAALIGTIINAGLAANVGAYASSTEKLIQDLADDGKLKSSDAVDLLVAYPPTQVVPPSKSLTTAVDTLIGTGNAEFFQGVVLAGTTTTFTALDTVDGGGGIDTLTLVDGDTAATAYADPAGVTVKNIEVLNYISSDTSNIDTTGALASIGTINVTESGSFSVTSSSSQAVSTTNNGTGTTTVVGGSTQTVTSGSGNVALSKAAGAITVTETKHTGTSTIDGGTSVTATVTSAASGTGVTIGGTTAPTGAVAVTTNSNLTAAGTGVATTITGGSTVSVTSNASMKSSTKAAETTTQGAVTVTGTSDTKSVTVSQAAEVTAKAEVTAVAGVTETAVVKFADLTVGQTIIVGGITFTAGAGGAKAAQVATAFSNLFAGSGAGAGSGDQNIVTTTVGTFTGDLTGWSTGAAATDTVTFTSSTKNSNVGDLANTGTGTATISKTDGVVDVTGVALVGGIATGAVTINDAKTTIATASVTNASGVTITSDALSTLNLASKVGTVAITNVAAPGKSDALALNLTGADVTALTDGSHYTSLAITTAGTSSSKVSDVSGLDGVTALTVNAGQALTLTNANGMGALKTVVVTGASGVSADFSGATVTSVDASGAAGTNSVTVDATKATYKGGTGADNVTITAAPTKAIDGGAGADRLVVNIAGGFNASGNTNITGFETLALGGLADASNYDATGFTALRAGVTAAQSVFTNVAAGTSLTLTDTATITYTLKDATGTADSLALTTSNAATKTFAVTAAGIESVALTATDGDLTDTTVPVHTVNLTATALKSITVGGSASVTLGNAITATTVDASALTGKFVYTADDASATITGSSTASDTITIAANNVTVVGGGGADTITINAGANLATITTGAGADRIVIGGAASNLNSYATITDFSAGDTLVFPDKGNESFNATKISLAGTASFQDYADAAVTAGGNASVNAAVSWFQFSGDTYVIVSQHDGTATKAFVNGTDIAVKLTGLVDLTNSFNDLGASNGTPGIAEIRG